jgi:hypothetical protein
MPTNASNATTALQNLKTLFTNVEAGGLRTGVSEIDAETRRLLTTRFDQFMIAIFDYGSRATQNSTAATRAAANNGSVPAQDATYVQLDTFLRAVDAQVAALTNPTSVSRRVHTPLQ